MKDQLLDILREIHGNFGSLRDSNVCDDEVLSVLEAYADELGIPAESYQSENPDHASDSNMIVPIYQEAKQTLNAGEQALLSETKAKFPMGSQVIHKDKALLGKITGYALYYPNIELEIETDKFAGLNWKLDSVSTLVDVAIEAIKRAYGEISGYEYILEGLSSNKDAIIARLTDANLHNPCKIFRSILEN